jgi:hypothetical protein
MKFLLESIVEERRIRTRIVVFGCVAFKFILEIIVEERRGRRRRRIYGGASYIVFFFFFPNSGTLIGLIGFS